MPEAKKKNSITTAVFNRICREVASGKSLRRALKGKGMPGMHKFYDYLEREPARGEQYARARRQGIEHHIDGIVELADTADNENAQAVRIKVDTRKWLASKILPRVYGDFQRVEMRADIRGEDWAERLRRAWERVGEHRQAKALPAGVEVIDALPAPSESVPALPSGFVEEDPE